MMNYHFALFSAILLAYRSESFPLDGARLDSGRSAFSIKLQRTNRQLITVSATNISTFDPTYVTNEIKGLATKYAQASQFLNGIGVNPDTHPESGYAPFDPPEANDFTTTSVNAAKSQEEDLEDLAALIQSVSSSSAPYSSASSAGGNVLADSLTGLVWQWWKDSVSQGSQSHPDPGYAPPKNTSGSNHAYAPNNSADSDGECTSGDSDVDCNCSAASLESDSPARSCNSTNYSVSDAAGSLLPVPVTAGAAQMPLTDFMSGTLDVLYYGPLNFGSPPQELTVDIDTGSADLWVPVNCASCNSPQFDPYQSSTYHDTGKRFSIAYGSGSVSGKTVQDVISLGDLSVPQQTFGAIRTASDEFSSQPNSGLLGLAFGSIARSHSPTFFENLLEQKKVALSVFSVHLQRHEQDGSEVCFGCYDTTKAVGPVTWNPVVSRTYWSISMDGLSAGSTTSSPDLISANLTAAVDTGTTLIYIPDEIAQQFYDQIPGAQSYPQYGPGFYTFPCSSQLSPSLSLNNQNYSIAMSDFNLGRTDPDSDDCVGGILGIGNGFPPNLAIIGGEFLKSWYSVYDYAGNRVGFAPSVNNR